MISSAWVSVLSALFAAGSIIIVAWINARNNRRSKEEREEDRRKLAEERGKLAAEHEKISAEAAEIALRSLRNELNQAYEDVARRRTTIRVQDLHIEQLGETVRKQAKRIVALEDWALVASQRLERLGIGDMPPVPRESDEEGR